MITLSGSASGWKKTSPSESDLPLRTWQPASSAAKVERAAMKTPIRPAAGDTFGDRISHDPDDRNHFANDLIFGYTGPDAPPCQIR